MTRIAPAASLLAALAVAAACGGSDGTSAVGEPDPDEAGPSSPDGGEGGTTTGDDGASPLPDAMTAPDGAPLPPASLWGKACQSPADCDDGLTCTTKTCVANKCVIHANGKCPWPAEQTSAATNLTAVGAGAFAADLSGAHWDPLHKTLWLCRNTSNDSRVFALSEDGAGGFAFAMKNGKKAEWTNTGDLEDVAMADYAEENSVFVMVETLERIHEYDFSTGGTTVLKHDWNTKPNLPLNGGLGAEGLTFVPDSFLMADGFVDKDGAPYKSTQGMGGLFFVGHQNGGALYAFNLNRTNNTFVFVGEYTTGSTETAAVHFNPSTGFLYVLHGDAFLTLEVLRLGSAIAGGKRKLESVKVYALPAKPLGGSDNMEGFALSPISECVGGKRRFFLTIDGGGSQALYRYKDFPCTTP